MVIGSGKIQIDFMTMKEMPVFLIELLNLNKCVKNTPTDCIVSDPNYCVRI